MPLRYKLLNRWVVESLAVFSVSENSMPVLKVYSLRVTVRFENNLGVHSWFQRAAATLLNQSKPKSMEDLDTPNLSVEASPKSSFPLKKLR